MLLAQMQMILNSIKLLKDKGIKVTVGHNLEDISKADVVVYSAAIKQDDPEMLEAKKLNIETIERADFLGDSYKML